MVPIEILSDELYKKYQRVSEKVHERWFLSCFQKTEQGVVQIKEWKEPSDIEVLKEMQASGVLSVFLSNLVTHVLNLENLIDREDLNLDPKSAIAKPTNDNIEVNSVANSCNGISTTHIGSQEVKNQIRLSQTESRENIGTTVITSTFGGQHTTQDVEFSKASFKTGQTGFPRGFGHKAKSKMLKPKNPEVNVWKVNKAKGHDKHEVKKPKPQKFQAKPKKPNPNKYASRPKNFEQTKLPYDQNRQQNSSQESIPFSSYESYIHTPWRPYQDMSYLYSPWFS